MINPQWRELPMSRTSVHGPKGIRAIQVRLYCDKVYHRSGKNLFWSIKNSKEVWNKLKSRRFRASSLSTYNFSMPCTSLSHNPIKDKLNDVTERTFRREGSLYLACNGRNACFFIFSLPKSIEIIPYGHVSKYVKLSFFI